MCFPLQTSKRAIRKRVEPLIMYTHACPFTSLVLMPEEEEKGPGFSRLHMHLVITDSVYQWQGDNDAIKSHGRLYDMLTVEIAWLI